MTLGLKWRLLDIGFVVVLLSLAAVPLLVLRGHALWGHPVFSATMWIAFVGTLILWAVLSRHHAGTVTATGAKADGRMAWWHVALVASLLGVFTVVCFYMPLRIHFWGGAEDFLQFEDTPLLRWMSDWDYSMNRPFVVLVCGVGRLLTPDRIDGFLWIGAALCWLNGLLLFAILREVLPQARLLPAAAAVLLIADRSDPSRFFVLRISNVYWMGVALLLASAWLFLWSYRRGSRLLLVLACALLGGALLTSEGAYPLAVLVPGLAWFLKAYRQRLAVWACAWLGTMTLLAVRFLLFLNWRGADAYQAQQSVNTFRNPKVLWQNLRLHLEAGFSNFQVTGAVAQHWRSVVLVLALVAGLACLVRWRAEAAGTPRRKYLLALGLAGLALLLGNAPFLSMPVVFRTQYYAAPGLAVLLASGLCLVGSLLGRRQGATVVALAVALVAANGTAESLSEQYQQREQTPVTFERLVHIFRQIHAVCPNPTPETLILLYVDDNARLPFLSNYCCVLMAKRTLGAFMIPPHPKEQGPCPVIPEFHPDGVIILQGMSVGFPGKAGYDNLLAFRLAADDTVTLLRRLPVALPPASLAARYNPLALIRPGPVAELPFLRYPSWVKRPHDLFDMGDGILLGRGWGRLENQSDELARRLANGAELVINPLGLRQRLIHLEVAAEQSGLLEAVDLDGKVLATAGLGGRGWICLTVPTDPHRLNLIRLRVPGGSKGAVIGRAFCPDSKGWGSRQAAWPASILAGELSLGDNWHPLEIDGGLTFHWVANDAEIILEADQDTPEDIVLDVQAGPSLGSPSFQLSLLGPTGKVLATATVLNQGEVHLSIPMGTPAGTVLQLHVEGGGLPVGNGETRILNFRVNRCAWRTN